MGIVNLLIAVISGSALSCRAFSGQGIHAANSRGFLLVQDFLLSPVTQVPNRDMSDHSGTRSTMQCFPSAFTCGGQAVRQTGLTFSIFVHGFSERTMPSR
jgi:hypothetical protein